MEAEISETSSQNYPIAERAGLATSVLPNALQSALDRVHRESEEKSLLLSELRHRMKNNLQAVQSLLRLQKSRTQNPSIRKELTHLEMQISALNGVDGELLVADIRSSVDLGIYLRRLLSKLKEAFETDTNHVSFSIDLDTFQVPCRAAANIGLLVNEAITNSFKHAVPAGATKPSVSLKWVGGMATLCVSDNGPGFQNSSHRHAGGTILIERLAERAGATVERDTSWPGVRYVVRFPDGIIP